MIYHFVKHIGFDIKADSLEQAQEIMNRVDEYNDISDSASDAIWDALKDTYNIDTLSDEFDELYKNCDAHEGDSEYVGYTEDTDDPEERLYDYLTEKEVPAPNKDLGKIFLDAFMKAYTRG